MFIYIYICTSIRKHDHFTPTRGIRRHVRALARSHLEGLKLQGHVSLATTNYLTYRIGLDDGGTELRLELWWNEEPLPSKYGTYKTVKARFWPWLSNKSP